MKKYCLLILLALFVSACGSEFERTSITNASPLVTDYSDVEPNAKGDIDTKAVVLDKVIRAYESKADGKIKKVSIANPMDSLYIVSFDFVIGDKVFHITENVNTSVKDWDKDL